MTKKPLPVAVSIGEPAGIGADLLLSLYAQNGDGTLPVFIAYGNVEFLRARAKRLNLDIAICPCDPTQAFEVFPVCMPVVEVGSGVIDTPGVATIAGAKMALESISRATIDCIDNQCAALITAPINKAAVKKIGFEFPGHTEFLAHLCADGELAPTPIMMLAHGNLRVVPLTIHVALSKVPELISQSMIETHVAIIARDLVERFGIRSPKIALTGLNPHAGEEGAFGLEDIERIVPAVKTLQAKGIDVFGPYPADTAFYLPNWQKFDVVVAMYHDQALIPIKTVAFEEAVNITLGLPIIRTSPDHGTAYDLAGSGNASTKSMHAAILKAFQLSGGTN
ncbi:MAG: 4-hydroxythreonine-4-phosphate dehydrogenase PdxA [Devosiaceae bacterium]|nr:4-hydroxythreonine-4-phosphate dehydrogenase PdxA [Devosiaceae bacterium]